MRENFALFDFDLTADWMAAISAWTAASRASAARIPRRSTGFPTADRRVRRAA